MTFPIISAKKKILFYFVMLCIPLLFVEVLVRAYFAFQVGPRVLLYGTVFSKHQEKFDPKGAAARRAQEETTVAFHENAMEGYTKYYPHQKLSDRDEFGNRINVTINSRGFRGKDFALTKSPGVIRIVTLGASSTFGFKDHDEETYPFYMEQMLNEALSRLDAPEEGFTRKPIRAFEVINLGVPHLRTDQIYSLFINEGLQLTPDVVTFYEGINDAAWQTSPDTSIAKTKQAIKRVPFANQLFRDIRYRSLSVALVGMIISQYKAEYSDLDVQLHRQGKKERFVANLQRIYDACRRNNIRFIVASQQTTTMENNRQELRGLRYEEEQRMVREKLLTTHRLYPGEVAFLVHKDLMDAEREWTIVNGVPYVDAIGAMDLNRQHLVTWVHLNSAGNQIVASVLSREIFEQVLGKELPGNAEGLSAGESRPRSAAVTGAVLASGSSPP